MTRVSGPNRLGSASSTARSCAMSDGRFVVPKAASHPPSSVSPVEIGGLLALQDENAPHRRDACARYEGKRALSVLTMLQSALLTRDGPDLTMLRETVGRLQVPLDPSLQKIIGAIRLRARVELARHERI